MTIVYAGYLALLSMVTPEADMTQAYSWEITQPISVDRVEIGSVKWHSCEGVRTRSEVDRITNLLSGVVLSMDEPLVSSQAGSHPLTDPICHLTMDQTVERVQGWMDYAFDKGVERIDLIEAWPHHTYDTIAEFVTRLDGLTGFVLDVDLGHPNIRRTRDLYMGLNAFRALTKGLGLEYGVIVTGAPFKDPEHYKHRSLLMALHIYGMPEPPDFIVLQSWIPEIPPETMVQLLRDMRGIWPR